MKINELYKQITTRLSQISTEADAEANYILKKLFQTNKLDLMLNKAVLAEADTLIKLEDILHQREKRIPLQYIFQEQNFRDYNFYVDYRVLIPRPETELLVDQVIELADKNNKNQENIMIADVGCGSGAIAISLALEIKKSLVFTVDISVEALEVAKINKKKLNVPVEKLTLIQSDKLEVFKDKNIRFDFIVSNPPYIPHEQYITLEDEVLVHEPETALLGTDNDGLGFYRYFAVQAKNFLKPGGFLCCEFGYGQATSITAILEQEKVFDKIDVIRDYNDIERIVTARLNYENFTG